MKSTFEVHLLMSNQQFWARIYRLLPNNSRKEQKLVKKRPKKSNTSTQSVHAGESGRKIGDSVATPIFQTATYSFQKSVQVRNYHEEDVKTRYEYGRYGSPTQLTLEKKLAEMFGTEEALVTSSGMSAVTDTFLALLKSGDHLVMTAECYRRTRSFSEKYLKKFKIDISFVEPNAEAIIKAITKKTKAVFVEIPTNPHLYCPDIPKIAKVTKKKKITLIVDPTIAAPFNCDATALGADIIILSLTKYLAGHNDVIGGAVLGSRKHIAPVRDYHCTAGTLLAPQAVYLILRGIKTAALRVDRQNSNTQAIAEFLESNNKIREVYYPGLESHPSYEIAKRDLSGCGCIVSFRAKAPLKGCERFLDNLKLFRIGPSLGGVESLAELVCTMSFWDKTKKERLKLGIHDDLIRLSIGIEDIEDLMSDLKHALSKI